MRIKPSHLPDSEKTRLSEITGFPLDQFPNDPDGMPCVPHYIKKNMVETGSVYNAYMPYFNIGTKQMELEERPVLVVGKHGDDDVQVIEITPCKKHNGNRQAYTEQIDPALVKGTKLEGRPCQIDAGKLYSTHFSNIIFPRTGSLMEQPPETMQKIRHKLRMNILQASMANENLVSLNLVREEIADLRKSINDINNALGAKGQTVENEILSHVTEPSASPMRQNAAQEIMIPPPEENPKDYRYMDEKEIERLTAVTGIPLSSYNRNRMGIPIIPPHLKKELFEPGSVYTATVAYYESATGKTEFKVRPVLILGKGPENDLIAMHLSSADDRKIGTERTPYTSWVDPADRPKAGVQRRSHADTGKIFSINQGNVKLPRTGSVHAHYPALLQEIQLKMRKNILLASVQEQKLSDPGLLRQEKSFLSARLHELEETLTILEKEEVRRKKEAMKNNGKNKWAALKNDHEHD